MYGPSENKKNLLWFILGSLCRLYSANKPGNNRKNCKNVHSFTQGIACRARCSAKKKHFFTIETPTSVLLMWGFSQI